MTPVTVGQWRIGAPSTSLLWIVGPCVIESRDLCLRVAERLVSFASSRPIVFKASFDKANRTSRYSFRGPGLDEGLKILAEVKATFNLPVTTDIHEPHQAKPVGEVVDLIQIPAFLCRQTDLLYAAARTGKPVNIKKAQFLSPDAMIHPVDKVQWGDGRSSADGPAPVLLTERGTTFGYGDLVVDMRSIGKMQLACKCPVVFDATHSVQSPGSGHTTGGDRRFVRPLALAAVAAGCNGVFVETHPDPDKALSDGPNMVPLDDLPALMADCNRVRYVVTNEMSE